MKHSRLRRAAAWGVHCFTALGLPLAFIATAALVPPVNAQVLFVALFTACIVDAVDGTLARAVGVREVTPEFDGRRLDDLIDFLCFAFVPSLAMASLGILPPGLEPLAVLPLLASGYGFCQDQAKTEDAFVGFPSYWNLVVLYIYVWKLPPMVAVAVILGFTVMVFVPIHYIYPTKTKLLKPLTIGFGAAWGVAVAAICAFPDAPWASTVGVVSFIYPIYYFILSGVHHVRVHRSAAESPDESDPEAVDDGVAMTAHSGEAG